MDVPSSYFPALASWSAPSRNCWIETPMYRGSWLLREVLLLEGDLLLIVVSSGWLKRLMPRLSGWLSYYLSGTLICLSVEVVKHFTLRRVRQLRAACCE